MSTEFRPVTEECDIIIHCNHKDCKAEANIDYEDTWSWLTWVGETDVDYCPEHAKEHEGELDPKND